MKTFMFVSLFMSLLLTSCVGTVQDSSEPFTEANDAPEDVLSFSGVHSVVPISDTRIEVYFYPATGGSGIYTYDVQVGSAPFPVSIPADVLKPDYRGLLKTTLTGLTRMATYQIKVEVRDGTSLAQSDSKIVKTATTFDNQVSDFSGISSAFNTPGQDGKDSIRIRWIPARSSGSPNAQDWDPESYEVVLVDAEKLTPNDMDIPYTNAQGRWVYQFKHDDSINEYIVRGIKSSTKYYVRMRSIHAASINDVYNPRKRSEQNNEYAIIATLSDSLADINFQPDTFALALSPGEKGLNSVVASWTPAAGVFDHFRIYYAKEGNNIGNNLPALCLSEILSPPGSTIFCKKVDYNSFTTPITGLSPYTDYEMILTLCSTTACGDFDRIVSSKKSIKTDPTFPAFYGITNVLQAQNLSEVGNVFLEFEIPNFSVGYFDGLIIKMRRTLDGSDTPVEITTTGQPQFHLSFNFLTQNSITIRGINYLEEAPYCFTLYPFKWDANGLNRTEVPNDVWKCIQPKPEGPTSQQFKGISSAYTLENQISLSWDMPSGGLFSRYELFWRKQSGQPLNWGDAISQAGNNFDQTNYGRILIQPEDTEVTLNGFIDGEYYFGMITYFNYISDDGAVTIRSETNINIKKCTVNSLQIDNPVDCTN